MMRVELGVEITLISVELMVERLFKVLNKRKSLDKLRKDTEVSGDERLLPRIRNSSEPKLKLKSKSVNTLKKSSIRHVRH